MNSPEPAKSNGQKDERFSPPALRALAGKGEKAVASATNDLRNLPARAHQFSEELL
jgi:hypothetical protein